MNRRFTNQAAEPATFGGQLIPYKNLPDSWSQVPYDDGSGVEDVIFLDGRKFLGADRALDYLLKQFTSGPMGVANEDECRLAEKYLGSLHPGR